VTIKAKWDKLHHGDINTCMWVFVRGRMFVINEADYDNHKEKTKKRVYEGKFHEQRKRKNK
jgi:hypothetical protein